MFYIGVSAGRGDAIRKEYAEVIFNFSKTKIMVTKSMLTLGASVTRVRVDNVLNKKGNTVIGIVITTVICAALVIGLVSNSAVSSLLGFTRDGIYIEEIKRLASTDLSGIIVDEMKIGSDIADIDLTVYSVERPNTIGDYDYFFDQVRLVLMKKTKYTL